MKEVHEIVRELREDNDKKQAEIAELLKITKQQYSLYETGRREFKLNHIRKLAHFYNISTDYILGTIDYPRPLK